MTDTAKLKAVAEKAKDNFIPSFMVSTRDVLELIAALEASHKRNAELEQALSAAQNNEIDARCHVGELEKRVGELEREREAMEAVTLAMRDEMRRVGINLETGGEA
ncbi:hypothetical protein ACT5AM_002898 [Cronobacter malonaticus]